MSIQNNNNKRNCGLIGRFIADSDGAAMIYVSIVIVALFAMVGLAVDFSRFYTTNTQAQSAADAAALSGATQLDGGDTAILRAIQAAQESALTSPIVGNEHTFATNAGSVKIDYIRFLHSLPASDDDPITDAHTTTDPALAGYIEVTTEALDQDNYFLAAVGAYSGQTDAVAVAGYTKSYCKMPPLMICNPWEGDPTMNSIDAVNTRMGGVTLLAKTKEGGIDAWDSGVMGLLDPPPYWDETTQSWDTSTNNGAKQVALALAKVPQDFCYPETPISIRTGQADAMRGAINVFFDIYKNPFFGAGNVRNNPEFRPAANVTKGYIADIVEEYELDPDTGLPVLDGDGNQIVTGTSCQYSEDPALAMGLPPDTCFGPDFSNPTSCVGVTPASAGPAGSESRIGNGVWDLAAYWTINHPDIPVLPVPLDGTGIWEYSGTANPTRYDIYLYEIASALIPNNSPTGLDIGGENGNPQCYTGDQGAVPLTGKPDRRVLSVAVINCIAEGVAGNSVENSEAIFMAEVFVIRPVKSGVVGGSDSNIWLEFVKVLDDEEDGVRDLIQLVR